MFLFKSMHIDQEMLHCHHHHIIIVNITIIILATQHTIDFWAVESLKPSVIMAAVVLRNKLEFIIIIIVISLYTHRL